MQLMKCTLFTKSIVDLGLLVLVIDGNCSGSDAPCSASDGPCSGSDGPCSGSDGPCSGSDGPCRGPDAPFSGSDGSCSGSDTTSVGANYGRSFVYFVLSSPQTGTRILCLLSFFLLCLLTFFFCFHPKQAAEYFLMNERLASLIQLNTYRDYRLRYTSRWPQCSPPSASHHTQLYFDSSSFSSPLRIVDASYFHTAAKSQGRA